MTQPQRQPQPTNYAPMLLALVAVAVSTLYRQFVPSPPEQQKHFVSEGGVHVIEPFLFNTTLLTTLQDASLWERCSEGQSLWIDRHATPSTLWEELAQLIWKDFMADEPAAGLEYWCNVLTPSAQLEWHQDKDEQKMAQEGILSHPIMGAVFYGKKHQFSGGELLVVTSNRHFEDEENLDSEMESVEAEYNRLIFLNVTRWHRVAPITAGSRVTFAVNLWKERPSGVKTAVETSLEKNLKQT